MTVPRNQPIPPAAERLDSWKEIAAYLKRDPRTLQRWEKKEGLPIHRHVHESQVSIYAYPAELDAWLAGRTRTNPTKSAAPRVRFTGRRALIVYGLCATLAITTLIAVERGGGPPAAARQRAFRQVWADSNVDYWASVSPDGVHCSFTEQESGNLWIRDLAQNRSRRITTWQKDTGWVVDALFSPDGNSIAYTWLPHKRAWEIHIIDLEGRVDRTLIRDSENRGFELKDWSKDGKSIVGVITSGPARQETQLALIATRDGSIRVLKRFGAIAIQRAAISSDGRYVAYDAPGGPGRGGDIFLLSTDGKEDHPLIEYPANEFLVGWGPKNDAIVFGSDRTGSNGIWRADFRSGRIQGEPQLLKADIGRVIPLSIARAGTAFFLLTVGMADVYVEELGSSNPPARLSERLIGAKNYPAYSPDGAKLLYESNRLSGSSIVIRVLDSGEEREIHPQLNSFTNPHWVDQGWGIEVFGSDGVTEGSWLVDPASGAVKLKQPGRPERAYRPPIGIPGPGDPTPSPDATMIARIRELVRLAEPERFTAAFAWSPDSHFVYFTRHKGNETELFRIPAAGGRMESTGLRMDMIRHVSIHPDGRHIAFAGGESNDMEVWALEGFLPH